MLRDLARKVWMRAPGVQRKLLSCYLLVCLHLAPPRAEDRRRLHPRTLAYFSTRSQERISDIQLFGEVTQPLW